MPRFHKVAVLMGGLSNEREISLKSGAAVVEGLRGAGYDPTPVVLTTERLSNLPAGTEAVFIALHGRYGEDGGVQADLDAIGLPYTGSGARASRIGMDKVLTKGVLRKAGVPTAEYEVLEPGMTRTRLAPPVVVKPPREGSSVGVAAVMKPEEWDAGLALARKFDPQVLVERFIPGREWTVGILGEQALPVIEIRPSNGWYGYEAKYVTGTTEYAFPEGAELEPLLRRCQSLALQAFHAIGGRGLGRIDFRVTPEGEPFVLELNSIPGFTASSLLPKAAARSGIGFSQLCGRIMEGARCDAT